MARLVFAQGARGESIRTLQQKLTDTGFDTHGVDGSYGGGTVSAVKAFQERHGAPVTGEADESTWTAITGLPIPSMLQRCLGLTSAFEGHGYTLAEGNFDGAGVTWGIIGFTLKAGGVSQIVKEAFAADASFVRDCFGDCTGQLLQVTAEPWEKQLAWADSVSSGSQKLTLAEPYKSGFAKLGASALGQELQQACVDQTYYQPALKTARTWGLRSEVGIALCFDIHVQNGGIGSKQGAAIKAQMQSGMSERDLRIVIANAIADNASARWREDVRTRKLAVATGDGIVHGVHYRLKNWGLDEAIQATV
ncbi:MAG TPA: peptidoglycan-binding protein [Thermoanaerobaculia bacterium]